MKKPENIDCKKGGTCTFKFCEKTKKWVCRRCGEAVDVEFNLEKALPLMEEHTKGGWFITPAMPDSFIDSFEDGRHICGVNNFVDQKEKMTITGKEHAANAMLIASAPLLYKEVLRLRKILKENNISVGSTFPNKKARKRIRVRRKDGEA